MAILLGCKAQYPALETVKKVDLEKYAGKWYEIATIPQGFQKGCICSMAEYKTNPKGYVEVYNSCRKNIPDGKLKTVKGKAFPVKGTGNSKLKVQFFWPFRADYWIVELAPDYSHAAVGNKSREYLWILSRTPGLPDSTYQSLLDKLEKKQFDVSMLQKTRQNCE